MIETIPPAPTPPESPPASAVAAPPPTAPPTPPPADPTNPPPPPLGDVRDSGVSVRDSLRARQWSASGAVKVLGNVDVEEAALSGTVSVGGAVGAGSLRSSGTLDVFGAVRVRSRLEVRGRARLRASVDAGEVEASGTVTVAGPLTSGGLVHYAGTLELSASLTAGRLVGDGRISVDGEVVASEVDIRLHRISRLGSIRAGQIRVSRRPGLPIPLPGLTRPKLVVDRIDAQEVELEGVECEYLQANRITLGADCHIARLDGHVVAQHPSARVGPESRSPPPYGLTR